METIYNVDYFIKKFEATQDNKWITNNYILGDSFCALGFCGRDGIRESKEADDLVNLFLSNSFAHPAEVNDGKQNQPYQQPTPKQRILAALYDIKAKQQPTEQPKEKTIYRTVVIDSAVKELQSVLTEN